MSQKLDDLQIGKYITVKDNELIEYAPEQTIGDMIVSSLNLKDESFKGVALLVLAWQLPYIICAYPSVDIPVDTIFTNMLAKSGSYNKVKMQRVTLDTRKRSIIFVDRDYAVAQYGLDRIVELEKLIQNEPKDQAKNPADSS